MHQGLIYNIECRGADGQVKWSDTAPNTLTSLALKMMLGSFFRNEELPDCFYLGLSSGSLSGELAVYEPSFSYARARVERSPRGWSDIELKAPDVITLSKAYEFTNTSGDQKWDRGISVLFLSTAEEGGEILSYAPLKETVKNGPRDVFPGDVLVVKAQASLRAAFEEA